MNIYRKLLLLTAVAAFAVPRALAQSPVTVSGSVVDGDGQPLPGAYVIAYSDASLHKVRENVMVDIDGHYTIQTLATDVLEFSFIGYNSETAAVGTRTRIDIVLLPSASQTLDEAVVVGYGTVLRQDLTGSVTNVRVADLNTGTMPNVDAAMQGKVAGAEIMTTTGEPGESTTIRIRGTRSIQASNEPLIVVDGVMDAIHDMNDLNPADIEDISILKDASSTAIYGSRGSNGVILITTKSGKESPGSKANITFKSTAGISQLPSTLDLMDATEFALYRREYYLYTHKDAATKPSMDLPYDYLRDPYSMGKGTDWIKEITRIAPYQDHYVSVSGGNKETKYMFSLNYNDNEGIIKASGAQRTTARANVTQTILPWLKFTYKMSYSYRFENKLQASIGGTSVSNAAIYLAPTIAPHDNFNPIYYDSGAYINTPSVLIEQSKYNITRHSTTQTAGLEATPGKHFKLNSQLTYYFYERDSYIYNPSTLPKKVEGEGGDAYRAHESNRSFNFEVSGTYKRDWNKTHHMDAVAVYNGYMFDKNVMNVTGKGYMIDDNLWNNMGAVLDKDTYDVGTSTQTIRKMSFIGRANYNYKSRYYITVNGRYDGSSNFAANRKWGFFPSVALKWNIYKEPWMKKYERKVDELSLRASIGKTGNDAISPYYSLPAMSSSANGYLFNGGTPVAYYPGRIENPDLSWETTTTANAALKGAFFANRLVAELEVYSSKTTDLLLSVATGKQTGYASRYANLGATSNNGIELSLNTRNVVKKNFAWDTSFTISHNDQMVLDIGSEEYVQTYGAPAVGGNSYMICGYKKGYPLNALWGFRYAGVWHNAEEVERNTHTRAMAGLTADKSPGSPRYYDINHDGMLDQDDLCYLGTTDPVLYGGLGNNFRWKNFKLNVYFTYSLGGKIYNYSEFYMAGGQYTNQFRYMVNAWHAERNPDSDLPRAGFYGVLAPSDFMVHDASYLRLQDLSLSYVMPLSGKLKILRLKDVTFTLSGNNVLLWKYYNGFDPDVSSQGTSSTVRRLDLGAYPKPRRITFTVQIRY